MTYTAESIQAFLSGVAPFNQLPPDLLPSLSRKFQLLRYRMGQAILVREQMPAQIVILYEGQARLLGYDPLNQLPITLERLQPGGILGWAGLVRGVACETAIASTETIGLTLPTAEFLTLLDQHPILATYFQTHCSPIEVFELLSSELKRQSYATVNLKDWVAKLAPKATVHYLPAGKTAFKQLDPHQVWFVSSGNLPDFPVGSRLTDAQSPVISSPTSVRLVGLPVAEFEALTVEAQPVATPVSDAEVTIQLWDAEPQPSGANIPYATEQFLGSSAQASNGSSRTVGATNGTATDVRPTIPQSGSQAQYPYVRAKGTLESTLACFQMLAQHLNLPFRREVISRVLKNQLDRTGSLSLQACGAVAELMGLTAQLVVVPASAISRLQAPALITWQDSFALIYDFSQKEVVMAVPETGVLHYKPENLMDVWGETSEVLLLQPNKETPQQRFGLSWFLPSLFRYRRVLAEVLIASFFVQLFGLANPLMIQVIIDKVLVQNSPDTLQILGIFLLVVAVFEALLTSLRTFLFVDTTNRIDMALGSEIIDHLLRLPLRYFEKRPVGELATRVNELENIRQFLTGTALTVVLDSIFSVIYIVVMLIYSWLLTLVSLATIPLFILLTVVVSPIVRRQLRVKAEQNASTQSFLVEVLSGIQTVKAQNIELRSRWQWQERYARYVSTGFKTVQTFTAASSTSTLLNQLSGLLVLWVGAYLVLQGDLTLGQLIAFRIIAGYVTSPLLRLVQLWQNFQETALSLERLSDIIDYPQEVTELDRRNIPMPLVQGAILYENVSFRFAPTGPMQLNNINLSFPAGSFVGIVGQSGSGKSTLMKLLPRLYEVESGRIFIDQYDISKVELYSLRQQIGIVPQDTLLFDGTVQENIALTCPDATAEEIIAAAKIAVAHDFIMGLPSGYNTRVGERGSALSGGQRQRIAIARTILQNPRLLILDEATSALDYDTERQLSANLAEAFQGRTVFFITHRLGTIKQADVILAMYQGSVAEQGTHDELMALQGRYYCLYRQQEAQL
ncbi:MAG: peptidase domain-containing ABC transporter [Leptolyngbyaceae bacterium]|nr:peptidase domain-containing ABC transporter [Leptolyngbyaceae bacterium]